VPKGLKNFSTEHQLFNCRDGSQVGLFSAEYNGVVGAPDISKDSSLVAIPSKGQVELLDTRMHPLKTVNLVEGDVVSSVSFTQNGKWIIATTLTGRVLAFDLQSERLKWTKDLHVEPLFIGEISGSGKLLVTAGVDKKIVLTNADTGDLVSAIDCTGPMLRASLASDDCRILAESWDNYIAVIDSRTGTILNTIAFSKSEVPIGIFMGSDEEIAVVNGNEIEIFKRNHPEWWWGHFFRPEIWFSIVLAILWLWRIKNWVRRPKRCSA
ncbi:MAG: hypothetical protein L6R28_19290, partial [Planctomycetes bacterium]|nr:hypothetical protein [Planctomycetota bacterium]